MRECYSIRPALAIATAVFSKKDIDAFKAKNLSFEQKLNRAHSRYTRLGVVRPCEKTSAQKCNTLMSNELMKPSLFHPLPSTPEWFYVCVCVCFARSPSYRTRAGLVAMVASFHMPIATVFVLRGWVLEVSREHGSKQHSPCKAQCPSHQL